MKLFLKTFGKIVTIVKQIIKEFNEYWLKYLGVNVTVQNKVFGSLGKPRFCFPFRFMVFRL